MHGTIEKKRGESALIPNYLKSPFQPKITEQPNLHRFHVARELERDGEREGRGGCQRCQSEAQELWRRIDFAQFEL